MSHNGSVGESFWVSLKIIQLSCDSVEKCWEKKFSPLFLTVHYFLPRGFPQVLVVGWGGAGGGVSPHARGGTQPISKGGEKVETKK